MEFLRLFLRRHLAGKPVVSLPNIGCFLRLAIFYRIEITVWSRSRPKTASADKRIIRPPKWHFYCSFLLVNNRFDGALLPISFHSSLHVHSWLIHCLFHPFFLASLLNLSSHWHIECNYLYIVPVLTYVLV